MLKNTFCRCLIFTGWAFCFCALGAENLSFQTTNRNVTSVLENQKNFLIHVQPLTTALVLFAEAANVDYIAPAHLLVNRNSYHVEGRLLPSEALSQLLTGTELVFSLTASGTFLISSPKKTHRRLQKSSPVIEETVVTALKREQLSQDVPLSISSLHGEQLSQAGKNDTRELFHMASSVSYHGAVSADGQSLRIRGIGSGIIAGGIEQSVGTIIDGVSTGPSGSGLQTLWDIERIEVLKGPQGILFGKNVSAGAINQITRDPAESREWMLKGRYETEYDSRRFDGFISTPLNDQLRFRLAAFDLQQNKGSVYNVVRQHYENTKNRQGIRGKLLYEQDGWRAKFSSSFDTLNERCCARVFSHISANDMSRLTRDWVIPALTNNSIKASDRNR